MINADNEPKIYAYAIFIAIMVGILGGIGFLKGQAQDKKTANLSCEELCRYETTKAETDYLGVSKAEAQYAWRYYLDLNSSPEKTFETQKQCIDYCSSGQ